MASSILLKFPRNTEINETKKAEVSEALSRVRRPLDSTKVNFKVNGVFGLPEIWKTKLDDPAEAMFTYEVELAGIKCKNSKICMKELSEEERAEMDAKNPKGKAAPPKGKAVKEEEPSEAELAKIASEREIQEESKRQLAQEWETLNEDEKHFRTSEDIFKEPAVKFSNLVIVNRLDVLKEELAALVEGEESTDQRAQIQSEIDMITPDVNTGLSICDKTGHELIEFEEAIRNEGGAWLKLMKVPIPEPTDGAVDAKGKAAPKAKGKGPSTDDLKPQFGRAWVDFKDLQKPGSTSTQQRVFIETCAPANKREEEGKEIWEDAEEFDQIFEGQRTYVYFTIDLSEAVTPSTPDKPEPKPDEIVPVKTLIRWPFSKNSTDDFMKQVAIAIKSLTREYYQSFNKELEAQEQKPMSSGAEQEAYDNRRKEFLYDINTTGKYHILKEKMKKTIVRIVKEHFGRKDQLMGLHKNEIDHFYSELYVFLTGIMRDTVKEMVAACENELHQNVTISQDQAMRERDHLIEKHISEDVTARNERLAFEEEYLKDNAPKAEKYLVDLIKANEGDSKTMLKLSRFYMRQGKLEKAEVYLRDAFAFDNENQEVALAYACLLCQVNRYLEAQVILTNLLESGYKFVTVNMLLSIAYTMSNDSLMSDKYAAISEIAQLRESNRLSPLGKAREMLQPKSFELQTQIKAHQVSLASMSQNPANLASEGSAAVIEITNNVDSSRAFQLVRLTDREQDELLFDLAEYLLKENYSQFAQQTLQKVQDRGNIRYLLAQARIQFQTNEFEAAISTFNEIIEIDNTSLDSYTECGHAHYKIGNHQDALKLYQRAIRISNLTSCPIEDELVFLRAGSLYIQLEMYEDARVMFLMCAQDFNKAFAYFNLGVADFNLGLIDEAEQMLGHVNYMDPTHAETWAYLTLVLLKKKPQPQMNAAYQSMNEATKLGLKNAQLSQHIFFEWVNVRSMKGAKEALQMTILTQGGSRNRQKLLTHLQLLDTTATDCNLGVKCGNFEAVLTEKNKDFIQRTGPGFPESAKNSLAAYAQLASGNLNVLGGHLDPLEKC